MSDARWEGIERTYTPEDVERLRGSVVPEHTIARLGAERLWELLHADEPVTALAGSLPDFLTLPAYDRLED